MEATSVRAHFASKQMVFAPDVPLGFNSFLGLGFIAKGRDLTRHQRNRKEPPSEVGGPRFLAVFEGPFEEVTLGVVQEILVPKGVEGGTHKAPVEQGAACAAPQAPRLGDQSSTEEPVLGPDSVGDQRPCNPYMLGGPVPFRFE